MFAPDEFRTFRYVQLRFETGDEPLTVQDFHGVFTGYPFTERGSFTSDDLRLAVSWRAASRAAWVTRCWSRTTSPTWTTRRNAIRLLTPTRVLPR